MTERGGLNEEQGNAALFVACGWSTQSGLLLRRLDSSATGQAALIRRVGEIGSRLIYCLGAASCPSGCQAVATLRFVSRRATVVRIDLVSGLD
jgi:hypothetical protein